MTPDGQAIYAEIVPLARSFARDLTQDIRPEDLAVLDRVLAQLMGRLKASGSDREDEA
jgi:DNA-binding MarR family transcriptional regulator